MLQNSNHHILRRCVKKIMGPGKARLSFFCIFAVLMAGCAKKQDTSNVITLWHWMTDRQQAFEELSTRYEQQTGVKVKVELFAPSETYSQRIMASAQAKVLPDIYGVLDKKEILASFIRNGFVADLTDELVKDDSEWEKSFFQKALDVNRFMDSNIYNVKPGVYGIPVDVTSVQMLYNKDLLKKAGITGPPKNFDEFIDALRALNRVGIPGLVSGWGEMWLVDFFAWNYAFNVMGEDKVMATYRGEVPYTDPDWIKVLTIFQTIRDNHGYIDGIVSKPNKFAEQDFALERAAFAFNGSWCVNVYRDMNPKLAYGVMVPPKINDRFPMKVSASGSSFVVNATSKHKKQAVDFLKWLTDKDQQLFLSKETNNLPANRGALTAIPETLSEFAVAMDEATHPTAWEVNEDDQVSERFDKGIQSIIIGDKTPEQVAQEVQAIKIKVMERRQGRMN